MIEKNPSEVSLLSYVNISWLLLKSCHTIALGEELDIFFQQTSRSMIPNSNDKITSQICTCLISSAVLACAKLLSDFIIIIHVRALNYKPRNRFQLYTMSCASLHRGSLMWTRTRTSLLWSPIHPGYFQPGSIPRAEYRGCPSREAKTLLTLPTRNQQQNGLRPG